MNAQRAPHPLDDVFYKPKNMSLTESFRAANPVKYRSAAHDVQAITDLRLLDERTQGIKVRYIEHSKAWYGRRFDKEVNGLLNNNNQPAPLTTNQTAHDIVEARVKARWDRIERAQENMRSARLEQVEPDHPQEAVDPYRSSLHEAFATAAQKGRLTTHFKSAAMQSKEDHVPPHDQSPDQEL